MATRRVVLGAGLASAVAGCTPKERQPLPSSAPSTAPSLEPVSRVLDLTELMADTPRPAAATAAARAAARLWLDNRSQGINSVLSAVQVEPGLFLSAEHGRRSSDLGSDLDPIRLTRYRARLAMRDAAGKLVVRRATRASMLRGLAVDAALFEVEDVPSGLAVASRVDLSTVDPGSTLHMVGYQAEAGISRFDTPITELAPQAGIRMTLLTDSGSFFRILAGIGQSEGDFPAKTFANGSSSGPVFTNDGRLIGTAISQERGQVTIGDILNTTQYGEYDRIVSNGNDLPENMPVQIVTCQKPEDSLIEELKAELAPIPSPGY